MSDEKHQVTISETSACICIRGSNRVAGTPIHILMSCVSSYVSVKLGPEWCNAEPFRPQKFGAGKVGTARPERLGPGRQAISVSAILPLAHRLQQLKEFHWARRKVLPSWLKT